MSKEKLLRKCISCKCVQDILFVGNIDTFEHLLDLTNSKSKTLKWFRGISKDTKSDIIIIDDPDVDIADYVGLLGDHVERLVWVSDKSVVNETMHYWQSIYQWKWFNNQTALVLTISSDNKFIPYLKSPEQEPEPDPSSLKPEPEPESKPNIAATGWLPFNFSIEGIKNPPAIKEEEDYNLDDIGEKE